METENKALREMSAAEYVFLRWLRDTHPALYAQAEDRQKTIGGFMDSFGQVLDTVSKSSTALLSQYVKGRQDLEVLKENLVRARAGEMPLQSAGGALYQPSQNPLAAVPMWAWALLGIGATLLVVRR